MSPRRRHTAHSATAFGYPSPEERQTIINRRDALFQEIVLLLSKNYTPREPAFDRLVQQYGVGEVQRQLGMIQKQSAERDFLIDEPLLYRKYRQTFARFGGSRRFLIRSEYEAIIYENATLMARRQLLSPPPIAPPSPCEQELNDLLLVGVDFWEDITPPAVPPHPADWLATQLDEYVQPAASLLTWGWKTDLARIMAEAKDVDRWKPVIPALNRMVFDPGLLNGWPGETASWASYHALHLLGALQVHSAAAPLLTLAGLDNDWLSDRLPAIWVLMGKAVEPILWNLLDDTRYSNDQLGLVISGLRLLSLAYPEQREVIIARLAERLTDPMCTNTTVNAYIAFVLNRLKARRAHSAIIKAFEKGRVNTRIFQLSDVSL